MKSIQTTITTAAEYSEDGLHRYSLTIAWDKTKPNMLVLMLAAGASDCIYMDASTCHVLENSVRLNYGSVTICNLFSRVGDYHLREDDSAYYAENEKVIIASAKKANTVVYCPGRGKAALKVFQAREQKVLSALQGISLSCISDGMGHTQFHPLSPKVRTWTLVPFKQESLRKEQPTVPVSVGTAKKKRGSKSS